MAVSKYRQTSRMEGRMHKWRQMHSATLQPASAGWLSDSGLKQVEFLFRAIVYQPAEPILIADNDRMYRDASCGAGKLLGLSRDKIIGRRVDDFAEPGFRPRIEHIWQALLQRGEQRGAFRLLDASGSVQEVAVQAAPGTLAEMESSYIIRILRGTNGVVSAAAIRPGLPRTALNAMMRKPKISRKDFS
jgi:PAS domain S-box-containing protein